MKLDPKTRAYRNDWARKDRLKNPEKYRARQRGRYVKHRDRILGQVRAYQEANRDKICLRKVVRYHSQTPEERRRQHLEELYGITPEIYAEMYAKQLGRCAICSEPHSLLDIDHCHEEHRVRGLLCGRCNKGIGLLRDNPEILAAAIKYLGKGK